MVLLSCHGDLLPGETCHFSHRSISSCHGKAKAQERQKKALFTQVVVLAGRIPIGLPEFSAEVVCRVEPAGKADLLEGMGLFGQQSAGGPEPVLDQRLHRGAPHVGLEAAPRLAAADVGGVGNVLEGDGLRIVLVDVGEHLLEPDLSLHLYPRGFIFGETVKMAEQILKDAADVALYRHLMARCWFSQAAVGVPDDPAHPAAGRVPVPEHHKGQCVAPGNGPDIFLINGAVFGGHSGAGKEDDGDGIGTVSGQLSDSVEHIPVDKYAVARLQRHMLPPHLVLQDVTYSGGDLKVGVPVDGPCPIGQFSQLIVIIGDRKFRGFVRYLFPQLMVQYDRHKQIAPVSL